jgi:hypothetical protein
VKSTADIYVKRRMAMSKVYNQRDDGKVYNVDIYKYEINSNNLG